MLSEIINERFNILSQGQDKPERLPVEGETVVLFVNSNETADLEPVSASLLAKSVTLVGKTSGKALYAQVSGVSEVDGENLPSIASYQIDEFLEKGSVIGELVRKRMIFNDF